MPFYESPEEVARNNRLEAIMANPIKVELASNYVIRWKHMSLRVRICTVLGVVLLVCFGLFVVAASIASTVLIPFVAVNSDTADEATTDVEHTNVLVGRLEKNVTKLTQSQLALLQRMVILERDNMCYHSYANSMIEAQMPPTESAKQLKNCLDGIIA
jgi:hypothetical protein